METLFGLAGTILFLSALVAQIVRIEQRQMADDMSLTTCWCWMIGMSFFLLTAMMTQAHWTLTINYVMHLMLFIWLLLRVKKYQDLHEKRMEEIRKNVMNKVKVIRGGKK